MKPIKGLDSAPPGLASYLNNGPQDTSWRTFYKEDTAAYRELRGSLVELQHGLCGYCEQALMEGDCQVEHVIPRSSDVEGHSFDLNPTNMLAACKGGSADNFFGPEALQPDPARVGEESCGQAKGSIIDHLFVDPRSLPTNRSLFRVFSDGSISADNDACRESGIAKSRVDRTIEILGLNVGRLKSERARRWQAISAAYANDFDNPEVMRRAASAELLPDENGILARFFSTNRSYFVPFSESVLVESIDTWI